MPSPAIFPVACAICSTDFKVGRQRFETSKSFTCSKMCLAELRSRNIIAYRGSENSRSTNCTTCGERIFRKPSQIAKYASNYCDRDCAAIGKRRSNAALITGREVSCEICGKLVWRTPATEEAHVYCSSTCFGRAPRTLRAERVVKPCGNCRKPMRMIPCDASRYKYCSVKCATAITSAARRGLPAKPWSDESRMKLADTLRAKWTNEWATRADKMSERMRGRNNPRYRDGRSRDLYEPGFTRRLKRQIARRDGFKCRLCGAPEGVPAHAVHHIDGAKHNHHPSNLVLLCNSCHGKLHHQMEKGKY